MATVSDIPPHTAAIIVPYRDRADDLAVLVPTLTTFLTAQEIPFHIWVVEQTPGKPFNKGRLINAGVLLLPAAVDYIVIHDVDMIPVDCRADYSFPDHPRQLYGPHNCACGGVIALSCVHFRRANGISNEFWGWGYEDCDLETRLLRAGLALETTFHRRSPTPPFREITPPSSRKPVNVPKIDVNTYASYLLYRRYLGDPEGQQRDGLNSCVFVERSREPLSPTCTKITVDV
jgi:hypothetical protein